MLGVQERGARLRAACRKLMEACRKQMNACRRAGGGWVADGRGLVGMSLSKCTREQMDDWLHVLWAVDALMGAQATWVLSRALQ